MRRWADFERDAPELAALGRERIEQFRFVFLGTVRADGGPRVNPVEAHFVEGDLALTMIWRSLKARDLLRDPRAFLHTPILDAALGRPGEFKLRVRAVEVGDGALREAVATAVERESGWRPPSHWHFFTTDVEGAAFHEYDAERRVHRRIVWTPERGLQASERETLEAADA